MSEVLPLTKENIEANAPTDPKAARAANLERFGVPVPATRASKKAKLAPPRPWIGDERAVAASLGVRILRTPPQITDILDCGAVGGIAIAGYVQPDEMVPLREGRFPASWRREASEEAAPDIRPAPPKSIRDAVTKRQMEEMLAEADADEHISMEAPEFLPNYTPVREEDASIPPMTSERPVIDLTDHSRADGVERSLPATDILRP